MTSIEEEFNCILCKESFNNKDDLQIHFRRHGDPKFNESIKAKGRVQNEAPAASEKSNDASESVNCDVCEEVFPTISKAITHKHKVHPEHDAKYFCPWCGKLFTLKHLYNKHLQTNHDANEESPEGNDNRFHCDSCNINFLVPSAMIYHNKFFHRQDTDLPIIGHSKKQKLCCQDLLPIYYCSFCGEEYINKVNLHKHICDDHCEENQRPLDVLRCPLCEAIFYHLDAYELHLTFHSSEDLYSETNEMNETDLTEFSLETVPPVMERIEDVNNLQNDETDVNAIGIESFLQMAMDEPNDGDQISKKAKSKKHKKHKKSKKSAITLDEFLNMNQDVFGEDLDFQGVEEVPTKVITRQLKPKKPQLQKTGVKFASSADLQKLQKQGIVVKMKSGKRPPPLQVRPVGQPVKVSPHLKNIISHTKTNSISASNEVLSKLMNQSSNQLKIVKKSAPDKASNDEQAASCKEPISEESEDKQLNTDPDIPEHIETDCIEGNKKDDQKIDHISKQNLQDLEANKKYDDVCESKKKDQCRTAISNKTEDKQDVDGSSNERNNDTSKMITQQSSSVDQVSPSAIVNDTLKNISKHITIKPVFQPVSTNIAQVEDGKPVSPKVVNETRTSGELNTGLIDESSRNKALDTLKNINSAITIKSLKSRDVSIDNGTSVKINEKTDQNLKQSDINTSDNLPVQAPEVEEFDKAVINQHENSVENQGLVTGPSNILKNISKNITIRSMSPIVKQPKGITTNEKNVSELDKHEDEKLMQENQTVTKVNSTSPYMIRDSNSKQNLNVNVSKSTSHSPLANVTTADENIKESDGEQFDDDEGYNKSNIQSNNDILKHLKNITAKPVPSANARITASNNKRESNDEQFDDDEDSMKSNSQSNNNILKHLKNITAKPLHGGNMRIAGDKNKMNSDGEHFGDDKDSMKPTIQSNNDIIKHLKNITTKPMHGAKINQQQTIARPTNTLNTIKGFHRQPVHKKEISDEIEIFNIDDSDSDGTETKQLKTEQIKATPIKIEPTKTLAKSNIALNARKNINKRISVDSSNSHSMRETGTEGKNQLESEPFSDDDEMHNETVNHSDDDFENNLSTNAIKANHGLNTSRQKADSFNSVFKNLSKHITVKSSNVSPSQSLESFNQTSSQSHKSFNQPSQSFNMNDDDVSDAEPCSGKVKITEITEDNDSDHSDICENKGIVTQSPDDSNSGNEHSAEDMEDSDEQQNQAVKKAIIKSNPNFKSTSECLLKNISKHITIKSLGERSVENKGRPINTLSDEKTVSQNKVSKELLTNPPKQNKPEIQNDCVKPRNQNIVYNKRPEPGSSSNQSMNTTVSKSPSVSNIVNKEIKVNTFQSETVIEEITTTVTKTIRRVNQVNQQVFNTNQISSPRMAQQKNGPRMGNNNQIPKNYQGITVRHASPSIAGPRIRQAAPIRPALGTSVRPSNQLVPIRRNTTIVRPNNSPRMQIKNMPRQLRPMTPLKISPNVMNPTLKRPSSEEASGPFSCFKKPKESLFPGNDTALEGGSNFQYASSSQTSKFCSSTKTVKDNTVVTSQQIKSQCISQQQQMSKQANASGLKIAKAKQVVQVERSEISASKRTTLEAIEKLQKQGLLVKKPRVEEDFSSPSFCGEDSDEYQGGE